MNRSVRDKSRDYSHRKQYGLKHHEAFFSARQRRAMRRMVEVCGYDGAFTFTGDDFVFGVKDGKHKVLELV